MARVYDIHQYQRALLGEDLKNKWGHEIVFEEPWLRCKTCGAKFFMDGKIVGIHKKMTCGEVAIKSVIE